MSEADRNSLHFTGQVIKLTEKLIKIINAVMSFFLGDKISVCSIEWKLMTLSAILMVSMMLNSDH